MAISPLLKLLSATLILNLSLSAAQSDDLYITAEEIGNNVVVRFEGSIDTTQLYVSSGEVTATSSSYINAAEGIFFVQAGVLLKEYPNGSEIPLAFGTRGTFFATKSSGDILAIDRNSLALPPDYVSGSQLRGEMTFAMTTLRGLGLERHSMARSFQVGFGSNHVHIKLKERARADLRINDNGSGAAGIGVIDPRINGRSQTLKYTREIYRSNTVKTILWLANLGDFPARFSLRSFGDSKPGMKNRFISNDRNVTASVRTGRFARVVEGRSPSRTMSAKVIYTLKTDRSYAGVLRGGDRNDAVRFRMSGADTVDNVGILIQYSKGFK